MSKNVTKALFLFCFLFVGNTGLLYAQFQQLPTPIPAKEKSHSHENKRMKQNPLKLPFWDDFSLPGIDSTKWIAEGVTHTNTIGNAPPSVGAILFDGVDEKGDPYSIFAFEQGLTDRLTSLPIDLSDVPDSERTSVFLSFFWQAGGKAEMPDPMDDLTLFFLDPDDFWIPVWTQRGEVTAEQFFFTYENILVDPIFQHEAFQFKFQSSGRLSGPFDSWLIDYVFLNKNRSSAEQNFPDRALTSTNERVFGDFSAVPLFLLQRDSEKFWSNSANEFKNLSSTFRAMEYNFEIREKETQNLIKIVNANTPFNPVPIAQERRGFQSNLIEDVELPEEETDWELKAFLITGDEFLTGTDDGSPVVFPEVDFRQNDTVRTTIPLRDFFAYDNGSVDYSAGINQRAGMLAVKYEVDIPVFLKGISINFTNFRQVGNVIDVMVWDKLDEEPLFVKEVFIPQKESIAEFAYFEIDQNISVVDTFYVGFAQFTNDFIYVGLDKNKDNGEKIFYNVAGAWAQNSQVEGSLMIRPHLVETAPFEQESESNAQSILVYPNPVQNRLFVEGSFDLLSVYDPLGREIEISIEEDSGSKIINFGGLQKGIYLLKFLQGQEQKTFRILVR